MKEIARLSVFAALFVIIFTGFCFGLEYKEEMCRFQGVPALSQGDANMKTTDLSFEYQCVDYIKRYYRDRNVPLKIDLFFSIDVARNYYVKYEDPNFSFIRNSGLLRFSNGGNVAPEPGDILVYDDPDGVYGHVAIVTKRNASSVETIEQNWSLNGKFALPLSVLGGYYNVVCNRTSKDGRLYTVLGWLGLRDFHTDFVGMFQDGWHSESFSLSSGRSQAFIRAYNDMGGQAKMGVPADNNGGGIFVHRWGDEQGNYVIIQDYKDSIYGSDGRCALIYNEDQNSAWLLQGGFIK